MSQIPKITVAVAEFAFFLAPKMLRAWVNRYTSERILACVLSGDLPFIPGINGGDAILFYPLPQCERYELLEYPELENISLFEGKIFAFIIPAQQRLDQYHLCGYDNENTCFDAGLLFSRGEDSSTQIRKEVKVINGKITWQSESAHYLTSFLMLHSAGRPHAAGYSRRKKWNFPGTRYLPHVVLTPDNISLEADKLEMMILIVDTDAWVPEIHLWESSSSSETKEAVRSKLNPSGRF